MILLYDLFSDYRVTIDFMWNNDPEALVRINMVSDNKMSSRFPGPRMVAATVAASLGTCTSGVCCAYNGAQTVIETFVNQSFYDHYDIALSDTGLDALWGALSAQTDIGAIFGSLLINRFSEKFGRNKTGLLINSVIIIIGSILQSVSLACNACELLFLRRFICGFSLGLACIGN